MTDPSVILNTSLTASNCRLSRYAAKTSAEYEISLRGISRWINKEKTISAKLHRDASAKALYLLSEAIRS